MDQKPNTNGVNDVIEREKTSERTEEDTKIDDSADSLGEKEYFESKRPNLAVKIVTICVILIVVCMLFYFGGIKIPHDKALSAYQDSIARYNTEIEKYNNSVESYNSYSDNVKSANNELLAKIEEASKLVEIGDAAYDSNSIGALSTAIENANSAMCDIPPQKEKMEIFAPEEGFDELKKDELEIKKAEVEDNIVKLQDLTSSVEKENEKNVIPDYTNIMAELTDKQEKAEASITVGKQIINPSEEWIIDRLERIGEPITECAAVTEDNDPNGNLNKVGGYTAAIYFYSSDLKGKQTGDVIEDGTVTGGCIEVYTTVEYAEKRDAYLATFDGTKAASGSHIVLGTIVIRTSRDLTASKQNELEALIISEFTKEK